MNEVVRTHGHPGDANLAAETFGMDLGMRRADRTGKRLETRRPLRNVADRAVGDDAETTERLVHRALNLAPERAVTDIGAVDVLDHADPRTMAGADIFVIGDPALRLFGGRKAGLRAPSGWSRCAHSRRSAADRGTDTPAAWWCSRSGGVPAPRFPSRCRSSACRSAPALQAARQAAARMRMSSRHSLLDSVAASSCSRTGSRIADLAIEPNSTIGHGSHGIVRTGDRAKRPSIGSVQPSRPIVLFGRAAEQTARRIWTEPHRPAPRPAPRPCAHGRDRISIPPAGSADKAPSPPKECTRDSRSEAR